MNSNLSIMALSNWKSELEEIEQSSNDREIRSKAATLLIVIDRLILRRIEEEINLEAK